MARYGARRTENVLFVEPEFAVSATAVDDRGFAPDRTAPPQRGGASRRWPTAQGAAGVAAPHW
jgi:hypothetical protein